MYCRRATGSPFEWPCPNVDDQQTTHSALHCILACFQSEIVHFTCFLCFSRKNERHRSVIRALFITFFYVHFDAVQRHMRTLTAAASSRHWAAVNWPGPQLGLVEHHRVYEMISSSPNTRSKGNKTIISQGRVQNHTAYVLIIHHSPHPQIQTINSVGCFLTK